MKKLFTLLLVSRIAFNTCPQNFFQLEIQGLNLICQQQYSNNKTIFVNTCILNATNPLLLTMWNLTSVRNVRMTLHQKET